jgi:GT2 family glycosyltransferase
MQLPMSPATVVVIILTYNQREKTLRCLASLAAAEANPAQAVVWDNGSQDGTADAIRQHFPHVLVHQHPTNLGVASGRNAGAALAIRTFKPDYLLFLDNDILVEPGFVSSLIAPLNENRQVGQTQAKLRFLNDRLRLNDGGGCRINFILGQTRPVGFNELDRGQRDEPRTCIACGGAMAVRSEVFQALHGFDARFDPFGPEDLDFSLRLAKAGYAALYIPQAVGYHEVSHTFGEGYTEAYARHKARHWFVFMRRHATPAQKLGFLLLGAPYMATRILFREARRGNLGAFRGLLRGLADFVASSRAAGSQ